ncbi:hypothetical protein BC477_15715 [Clavibacter michiganensis subsp. michiganensis]|nr:hypothetical protein BC477_15715 [Clavibacter michiganensis subsp. michiganensis]
MRRSSTSNTASSARPQRVGSRWTWVSRAECGSTLATTRIVSAWPVPVCSAARCLEYTRIESSSLQCTSRLRSCRSAGCWRRISLRRVISGAMDPPSSS